MKTNIDSRRITFFLLFAFGITWSFDLAIYLMGGLSNLKPGTLTWFLSIFAMVSPALATVLTRMVTREGWNDTYLQLHFKQNKRYWLVAWVGTPILLLLGIGISLAWLTLKSKRIWPAVITHAAVNGMAPLALLLVKGQPNPLLGPAAVGLVASIPFTILGLTLFLHSEVFSSTEVLPRKSDVVQHPAI